jgi:DNA-binding transcriptional MerR regulator
LDKSPDAFRTISEAADELNLPQHVLRFWETRFATIKPLKRGGGRRYYRPEDVLLLKGIRHLLYDQGFTIKGVQRILKDRGIRHVIAIGEGKPVEALPPPEDDFGGDHDTPEDVVGCSSPPACRRRIGSGWKACCANSSIASACSTAPARRKRAGALAPSFSAFR